ncbi:small ribosomal subunit biogenesis GTPase RsgA [Glaciecola petra]|uniref:Small ribosomal subunit biogenesis GTPase RsgA n=1 Tax=Glaciecola petra TaxID=3075602 RepID=A0ABU2ZKX4_9ALTE|nr:small ribosomal subunit biogenesis GTPase RsgA [Aestuariibacter sp. P117]MDT0593263.1 small ribosomal subunit biogenesis GTPase RsgA [Aestuariibacter sp. P117]
MAKKPKLSKNQQRQIAQNRDKRIRDSAHNKSNDNDLLGEAIDGRVISRFGKQAIVETLTERNIHKCYIRRTIKSVVCGDKVIFRPSLSKEDRDRGIIEAVMDRQSTLSRPDYYDGIKPIAANIDQIIVVSSIVPTLSTHIIDRYIVACEHAEIKPTLVINKVELLTDDELSQVITDLEIYKQIGYHLILVSCKTRKGLPELSNILKDKVNVLVGQSGVGKSSIINQLLPDSDEVVGEVSNNSGLGQHTTTAAKLIPFDLGGELIDSPGVREFGLWHLPVQDITEGFVEFREYLGACKFSDCKHKHDPGCLITQAVKNGDIDSRRYESYIKIVDSLDQNRPSYIKE